MKNSDLLDLKFRLIAIAFVIIFLMFAGLATGSCQEGWRDRAERKAAAESAANGYSRWPYKFPRGD